MKNVTPSVLALLAAVPAAALGAVLALGASPSVASPEPAAAARTEARTAAHAEARTEARPIIVRVEGTAVDGFTLHYADGSTLSPPTDSEAAAECSEYDTRAARLRCQVEVDTWYRDLGDLKRSLAWVRAHE